MADGKADQIEVSSRPAEMITSLARLTCTALSVASWLASALSTVQPSALAITSRSSLLSTTTMLAGSAPRSISSCTARLFLVP